VRRIFASSKRPAWIGNIHDCWKGAAILQVIECKDKCFAGSFG